MGRLVRVPKPATINNDLSIAGLESVLPPGMVSLSISGVRWQGADLSEVNFPVVDMAIGLGPRVQLGASIPRIVGAADPTQAIGGVLLWSLPLPFPCP